MKILIYLEDGTYEKIYYYEGNDKISCKEMKEKITKALNSGKDFILFNDEDFTTHFIFNVNEIKKIEFYDM